MALKIVTAPTTYPVTLAEAKLQLHEDSSHRDAQIEIAIKAATEHADGDEGFLGRALIDQTWDLYLDVFPVSGVIEIPLPPLIEVVGVFHLDSTGDEQEFSAASYVVDSASEPARIKLAVAASWPTISTLANAVRVRFRAGYLDSSVSPPVAAVPFDIKAAILLFVEWFYDHPQEPLPPGIEHLLRRKRKHLGMA